MGSHLRNLTLLLLVGATLVPAPARAARPPSYEVEWRHGGPSAPFDLLSFEHPAAGAAVFAAGYAGGVAAVGRAGVIWRWAAGNTQIGGIASGDLNDDGTDDVVAAVYDGRRVIALDGVDGTVLGQRAFPVMPEGVAVGDADDDGVGDLYVVTQSSGSEYNSVHLLVGEELEPAWTRSLGIAQTYILGIDTGDVDGDGRDDVVFGTYSNGPKVYAFDADGEKRWEVDLGGLISDVVVADGGRTVFATRGGGLLASIDARTGTTRWSLPSALGFSKVAAADLDGDGTDDAAWALYGASGLSPTYHVMGVDGADGVPLWARTTLAPPKSVLAGDIDGDGDPDVAVTTQDAGSPNEMANFVWAYEGSTGRPLWNHAFTGEQTTFLSDLAFADVAGDTHPEVVVAPYSDVLTGIDGSDGSRAWSAAVGSAVSSATVGDLDGDGIPEVVHGGRDFHVTARRADTGEVRWSRDLGGQVYEVATVGAGEGADVLAIALSRVYRLRGSDGAVRWSWPLQGLGAALAVVPQASGEPLVVVAARARRMERGPGNSTLAGQLAVFDAGTGLPRWQIQTVGTAFQLEVGDVNEDGRADLVVGMANNNLAVAAFDGTTLGTRPDPLWQTASDGTVGSLSIVDGDVVTVQGGVNAVVAQDGATGAERWRRAMGSSTRGLGTGDVNGDGVADVFVATEIFSERIAAVDGTSGAVLFHVPAGTRFVTSAAWTDVSGDGEGDLLYASDGGTFGDGGVFAVDGTTLGQATPHRFWSYGDVNATALVPVGIGDQQRWLAYGFPVRPDALTLLRPIPEEPDEEGG